MSKIIERKTHNRRKYMIFALLTRLDRPISALDLMREQKITRQNADKCLCTLHSWGYLLQAGRGKYKLAAMGRRVYDRLKNRRDIEKTTGEEVSLNLAKPVPIALLQKYHEITGRLAPINI